MNFEEARNVLWLTTNKRPLGELLDDGYLTQSRLEWAAKKAYDPALRQAAQVILDSLKQHPSSAKGTQPQSSQSSASSLSVGITLEKARTTLWPFRPFKGQPLGELVDSRQLSLKDLGYGIENTWDKNVRQATIALLLVRLEQVVKEPEPPAGFVRVLSGGRSYAQWKESRLTLLEGMFLGALVVLILTLDIWWVLTAFRQHPNAKPFTEIISSPNGIIALAIVLIFGALVLWLIFFIPDQITKRMDKQIEAYQFGHEGEEKTVQMIVQALDGKWTIFRNIRLPGRNKGDLDIVLVGPPGVWALEVKNLRGNYRNIGENWEYRQGNKWKTASTNPSRQANKNAARLGNFFKADHLDVWVNAAIVWVNEESLSFVENPTIAVWLYNRLPDELGNIWHGEKLSEVERKKIEEKFQKLFQAQKQPDRKHRG
jgi:hypothetical protein